MKNINTYKTQLLREFNYCKRIFNGGIETESQLQTFTNLCQAYVDNCNYMCKQNRPKLGILQCKKYKSYKSLEYLCSNTVADLSGMINSAKDVFNKANEEAEMYEQIETRMRIEAAVAFDIKENERQRQINDVKKPIGFGRIIDTNKDNNNGCTEI